MKRGKTIHFLFFIFTFLLFSNFPLFAAADHPSGFSWKLIWQGINFLLFLAILYRLMSQRVRDLFFRRRESIKTALEEAAYAKLKAEEKAKEYEKKLALLNKEREEIIALLKEEALKEREKILAEAEKEASKIRKQAQALAEEEVKKARGILREEMIEQAIALAEEELKKSFKAADQERLVKEHSLRLGGDL